jgi:pimeloyl-ACP methyl ester carboxylesterase
MHQTLCIALGLSSLVAVSCAQSSLPTAPAQTSGGVFKSDEGQNDAKGEGAGRGVRKAGTLRTRQRLRENRLASIKVPTLVTIGNHDEVDPSLPRETQQRIPGAQLVVLPDSGHMTFVDRQDLFNRTVNDFVHK